MAEPTVSAYRYIADQKTGFGCRAIHKRCIHFLAEIKNVVTASGLVDEWGLMETTRASSEPFRRLIGWYRFELAFWV